MDEDNDLLARLNILTLNSLNLVGRVEQMMENRGLCGDAVHLAEEEQGNAGEEQDVDEGGDVGSEGWRTPPEDPVGASIILFFYESNISTINISYHFSIIRRRSLQKDGGRLQRPWTSSEQVESFFSILEIETQIERRSKASIIVSRREAPANKHF